MAEVEGGRLSPRRKRASEMGPVEVVKDSCACSSPVALLEQGSQLGPRTITGTGRQTSALDG